MSGGPFWNGWNTNRFNLWDFQIEKAVIMKPVASLVLCALVASFPGCSETPVDVATSIASAEIVNTTCPIMGSPVVAKDLEPALIKDWNGKKVGFCCPPCLEEWDELTDAQKAEKLAKPPAAHHTAHEHADHDHAEPKADEQAAETK